MVVDIFAFILFCYLHRKKVTSARSINISIVRVFNFNIIIIIQSKLISLVVINR